MRCGGADVEIDDAMDYFLADAFALGEDQSHRDFQLPKSTTDNVISTMRMRDMFDGNQRGMSLDQIVADVLNLRIPL
jgi:hypothetical protein